MSDTEFQNILKRLDDHDNRLQAIERSLSPSPGVVKQSGRSKQVTLREIVKGRKFNNGQEQIAVIVGYHEKMLGAVIEKKSIPAEWFNAKMPNKYDPNYLRRVIDDLIRIDAGGHCDLTGTGEEFFENFIRNEPINEASK